MIEFKFTQEESGCFKYIYPSDNVQINDFYIQEKKKRNNDHYDLRPSLSLLNTLCCFYRGKGFLFSGIKHGSSYKKTNGFFKSKYVNKKETLFPEYPKSFIIDIENTDPKDFDHGNDMYIQTYEQYIINVPEQYSNNLYSDYVNRFSDKTEYIKEIFRDTDKSFPITDKDIGMKIYEREWALSLVFGVKFYSSGINFYDCNGEHQHMFSEFGLEKFPSDSAAKMTFMLLIIDYLSNINSSQDDFELICIDGDYMEAGFDLIAPKIAFYKKSTPLKSW